MRKLTVLLIISLLLSLQFLTAQSVEVPVRIAYIREYFDGTPTGVYLLEDSEARHLSGDYQFATFNNLEVAWSPDCSQLIFTGTRPGEYPLDVQDAILVDLETGDLTQLTSDLDVVSNIFWSPVDNRIVFMASDPVTAIGRAMIGAIEDMIYNEIYVGGTFDAILEWSPDGNSVLFRKFSRPPHELHRIDLNSPTYESTVITQDGTYMQSVDVSLDARQLIFSNIREAGFGDIYLMDMATLESINLTNSPANYGRVLWSPSNEQIAYELTEDIYSMNADGSSPTNMTGLNRPLSYFTNLYLFGWTYDEMWIVYDAETYEGLHHRDLLANSFSPRYHLNLTNVDPEGDFQTRWYPCMLPIEESD